MRLAARGVPVVAMSPIIGGVALKGPADRMLTSLGHESSALGVARLYAGLVDVYMLDAIDDALVPEIAALGMRNRRDRHDHGRRGRPGTRGRRRRRGRAIGRRPRVRIIGSVSRLAAIIPVGTFEGAKSRLGGSLDAEERHDLVDGLLARTVEAALAVARLDESS